MNYIVMIVALILFIVGTRFFVATQKTRDTNSPQSAVGKMFVPTEDAAAKKLREMRENQERLQTQQQKMQQDRLNTY